MKSRHKGILCILVAAFSFALMAVCIRMAGDVPSFQKAFFRNFVALLVVTFLMLKNHDSFQPAGPGNWKYLIARAVCGTVGLLCNFYAVDHLVLSDASMLNKMSPFFAILFSYFLLKEKLTPMQTAAVVVAFTGALFIVKPSFANLDLFPSFIGLVGGMGAGMAYTIVRIMSKRGERAVYIVFIFSAFSCLVTLPYVLAVHAPMTWMQLLWLLGAGIGGAAGQFGITAAYSYAPARELSVYDYSQVIFAAVLGFFLFGDVPDGWSVLGYLLICSMALLMFWYHNYREGKH